MSITLIVGLGNPGAEYVKTRHNAGFWLLDQWAEQQRGQFRHEAKFHGEMCRIESGSHKYYLLKPSTFMNLSGKAVAALANFYKIPPEQILVAHDELDFAEGVARLKQGGGDGRHNGLKSIIACLGSNQFLRLRIGIGHPGHSEKVLGHVLGVPSKEQQAAIQTALDKSIDVLPLLLAGELHAATQRLHTA